MRAHILSIALLLFALPALAKEETVRLAAMNVRVWTPDIAAGGKLPVIIFSHGYHGCATQSEFLMQAFARDGYIVFAPYHRDAICGGKGNWLDPAILLFGRPGQWTDQNFDYREYDIRQLIAAIKSDGHFRNRVDWDRFGLAGHSLGGYAVLGLGGAWPSWKIPGVKAILAMSAYTEPYLLQHTLKGITEPVMYQGGTNDAGITPAMSEAGGAYDQTPAPKYYVEFAGANHLSWINGATEFYDSIDAYGIAFMDHYVKGMPANPILTQAAQGVSQLRYDSELGHPDAPAPPAP